jgi:hypothetical protein
MRHTCAVILMCAAATVGPGFAQNAGTTKEAQGSLPCGDLVNRGPATKEDEQPWRCPPPSDKMKNIEDGTKRALACEWGDPKAVRHVLEALRLFTIPEPEDGEGLVPVQESAEKALSELIKEAPGSKGLYTAALGDPDKHGEPRAQGLPDFLDDLAEANTQNLKKPENEDDLFKQAGDEIDQIFASPEGPQKLVKIRDFFAQDKHVALYKLLKAYPGYGTDPEQPATQGYACSLEILRAAYGMNADRLKEVVTEKVTGPKK